MFFVYAKHFKSGLKFALFLDAMNYLLAQEMESERTWNEYERQKQRTLMNSKRQ